MSGPAVEREGSFLLQVGRQILRIVVVTPGDVFVTAIPSQEGNAWIIMQNKGQVDAVHRTRESALARAREVASASRGRVFVFENERLQEDHMSDRRALLLVIGVVVAGCLVTVVARGSGRAQQQRTPEEYAKFLEGAERVARMQVPRVVEALDLKPGLSVADIGSGSGLFTRPIAKRVAPGIVYAVDIDGALLKIVEQSAKDAGLGNVRTVHADAASPKLPQPVDLVFICDTLHHIANQGGVLESAARVSCAGRPRGRDRLP